MFRIILMKVDIDWRCVEKNLSSPERNTKVGVRVRVMVRFKGGGSPADYLRQSRSSRWIHHHHSWRDVRKMMTSWRHLQRTRWIDAGDMNILSDDLIVSRPVTTACGTPYNTRFSSLRPVQPSLRDWWLVGRYFLRETKKEKADTDSKLHDSVTHHLCCRCSCYRTEVTGIRTSPPWHNPPWGVPLDNFPFLFTARCYAYRGLCRRKMSIWPSVCHTPVFCRNG